MFVIGFMTHPKYCRSAASAMHSAVVVSKACPIAAAVTKRAAQSVYSSCDLRGRSLIREEAR